MHDSEDLVVVVDGELLTSTETICTGMKAQHASTMKLLRKHLKQLETFGEVRFEIRLNSQGSDTEYAMLNEQQSALLISLMRNRKEVVSFKVKLIREFFRMRDALGQRDMTLWRQLQVAIAKEVDSAVRASFGSRLMLDRKKDKPILQSEIHRIESEIQPGLLLN